MNNTLSLRNSIRLFMFTACILLSTIFRIQAQQLKVGAAKRLITQDPLIVVSGGVGTPKTAHTKKGDLFVRAMVLEKVDLDSLEKYEYISQTSLGERTGEILVTELLSLIKNSPSPIN